MHTSILSGKSFHLSSLPVSVVKYRELNLVVIGLPKYSFDDQKLTGYLGFSGEGDWPC